MQQQATLDPLRQSHFNELVASFGIEAALKSKLAACERHIAEARDFRWHSRQWEQLRQDVLFEIAWLRHPANLDRIA